MCVVTEDLLTDSARAESERLLSLLADVDPLAADLPSACAWLDAVRSRGLLIFDRWHYVNQPINPDGLEVPPRHPDDVVFAIRESLRTLDDPAASDFGRAFALRVLLHTVGDIHQPLHTVSRFSLRHPEGDRGGNDFAIAGIAGVGNLHRLWDLGVGQIPGSLDAGSAERLSAELLGGLSAQQLPERSDLDPDHWAAEGLRLAQEMAYAGIAEGEQPSQDYLRQARPVVRRQLALAAHRLAALLNARLGTQDP